MPHLHPDSEEWRDAWDALREATGDCADCCPETGERWQYMGTFDDQHQFRHRHRPQYANGRPIQPIKGFAGQHWDRVYLHIDAETLAVTRVHVKLYLDDKPSDYTKPEHQKMNCPRCAGNHPLRDCPQPDQEQFEANCSGAFDGFSVSSDADPGL